MKSTLITGKKWPKGMGNSTRGSGKIGLWGLWKVFPGRIYRRKFCLCVCINQWRLFRPAAARVFPRTRIRI